MAALVSAGQGMAANTAARAVSIDKGRDFLYPVKYKHFPILAKSLMAS